MNKTIRILLVDDHELIRQGLRHMLDEEDDMEVVGDCADADEAFTRIARLHPDTVLMDAQMPGMNGIEATRSLKGKELDYGVDVIILGESSDCQAEAMTAGAASYLLKGVTHIELAQTIRQVYQQRHSREIDKSLAEEVVELVIPPPADAAQLLRFMCQLGEIIRDDFSSIVRTVGSWDCGTSIIVQSRLSMSSSLLIKLANMPEVEKVEDEPATSDAFADLPKKFRLPLRLGSSPSKKVRVTLQETGTLRQETAAVSN